jgi:hypothetical protein
VCGLDIQPLLSLKGDAQAFKNAVCVRNLSGAFFWSHGKNNVAKDGSAFSLPFKRKGRKEEKILPGGVVLIRRPQSVKKEAWSESGLGAVKISLAEKKRRSLHVRGERTYGYSPSLLRRKT